MEEQALPVCVDQLLSYDHKSFVQSCQFSEKNENNLKMLMKVTNYFREVISVHELTYKTIQAKSVSLSKKHQQLKQDIIKMGNLSIDVKHLSPKVAKVKENLCKLIERTLRVVNLLRSAKTSMSNSEHLYYMDLVKLSEKIDGFYDAIENINKKRAVIDAKNEELTLVKKCYFQDCQFKLVKENLHFIGEHIESLLDDISAVDRVMKTNSVI